MKSIVAWFARHPVASNLLMFFLLVGGVVNMSNVSQEAFPEFTLEVINVEVPYVGASPTEIEQSIVQPIEQQLSSIEGVTEMTAVASEGRGSVRLEFSRNVDISKALNDVKSEIDRITVFPDEAEEPIVSQQSAKTRVAELAISGDLDETSMKELALSIKDDLVALQNVSLVEVKRARDYEISIEVSREKLRAYGLSLIDVSNAIRRESLELPAGNINTAQEDILIRTLGRNLTQAQFEEIIIRVNDNGSVVRITDIASVKDGFQTRTKKALFKGKQSVFIEVFRVGEERVLSVVEDTQRYLDEQLIPSLPSSVEISVWRNDATELDQRISLLIKNAGIGILLVALALALFLDLRLALWVSVGIGVSFVGAFTLMSIFGFSINSLSMFGFILAIGIVVDDAIVTGENIFAEAEKGKSPIQAAVDGATRVAAPVIFAVATTIAAFVPLLFLPGILGKFLTDIPAIVIIILALSLVESLLILPHHLATIDIKNTPRNFIFLAFDKARESIDYQLKKFIDGPLHKALTFTTQHWFVTISSAVALMILTIGILANGFIKFSFFPQIEGNYVTASVELPEGTSLDITQTFLAKIETVGLSVANSLDAKSQSTTSIVGYLRLAGEQEVGGGPPGGPAQAATTNIGSVVIQLSEPSSRSFGASEFEAKWREQLLVFKDRAKINVSSSLVSLGEAVQVEVSADSDGNLRKAINQTEQALSNINGVFDISNDFNAGKREFKLTLKDQASQYGVTLQMLALQTRAAFFGNEALRVQRGRDEVRVYVRLPDEQRQFISDLYDYRIQTPSGDFIPLEQVASISQGIAPSTINRRNGNRIITITADIDQNMVSSQQVNGLLLDEVLPNIHTTMPDVQFDFGGEAREMGDVGSVLARNFGLALLVIFSLLAIPFKSYSQPIIVMLAIPFGLVGAVIGHLVMDLYLGMLSIFGLVGLAGVVINGALVQVDFANEAKNNGVEANQAWIEAGKSRFRPIFLTAITTFLGVGPLMLEQSVQAQFLIPMAAAIAFGVVVGTFIQMLLVPALGSMLDHLKEAARHSQKLAEHQST
ncbi:efflux RND transporter permease subunit [Glaciecola petra]|uniref:Efflux RND transporter permease subunit n=1 Tax=Glaciecola petra TaxID=3075602 RepID=A0ABU2ZWB2_9ALTE|nr:efflux RND transporter permease subunit [Aestuariibacter sp. P117]MDT0596303.1 efflux RND transporter permease subunit [Aestuariibacter sp. P117]